MADGENKGPVRNEPKIVHRNRARGSGEPGKVRARRVDSGKKPSLIRHTLSFLYKNLYILGITLLRRNLRMKRWMKRFAVRLRGGIRRWGEQAGQWIRGLGKTTVQRIRAPFVRLWNVRAQMRPVIEKSRRDGKIPFHAYGEIVFTFLRLVFAIFRTLFNYAIPIAAALFLITTVRTQLDKNIGLNVYYMDQQEPIGFIATEADFEEASRILKDRYISDDATALIATPRFEVREAEYVDVWDEQAQEFKREQEPYTPVDKLADAILELSQDKISEGYGFYVDGQFYGAVADYSPVWDELELILEENATGVEGEEVAFAKSIVLGTKAVYPSSSMVEFDSLKAQMRSYETVAEIYTVELGDSPSLISSKTGVPYASLIALNPELEEGNLAPGQELVLTQARPFMTVKNIYTDVYTVEIPFDTEEIPTDTFVVGYRVISVAGQPGIEQVTADVSKINGVEVSRDIQDRVVLRNPVTQKVIVGTHDPRTILPGAEYGDVSSKGFLWPTSGGVITVGLGGYPGHTGVDIPRPAGTPIFASMSGTVVKAVNSGVGYGRHVIIDHGNGYTTLYAHASALHVSVGQVVRQGDILASVGRTGNATGNHLHFEVRLNGQIMNPAHYIG